MPPGGLPPTVRSLIGLTQQASVRRGPRTSVPSLFTASHCSPRSPCLGALFFHSKPLFAEVAVPWRPLFSQQATVRRGRRALAPSLFTASHCSPRSPCLGALFFHSKPLFAEVPVPRRPLFSKPLFAEVAVPRRPLFSQQATVRRGPRASAPSLFTVSLAESEASAFLPNRVCVSSN